MKHWAIQILQFLMISLLCVAIGTPNLLYAQPAFKTVINSLPQPQHVKMVTEPLSGIPEISNFTVSPLSVVVQKSVTFSATISNGTTPYTCTLKGPNGQVGQPLSSTGQYTHTFIPGNTNDGGVYTLSVTDAAGQKATDATTNLTVIDQLKVKGGVKPPNPEIGMQMTIEVTIKGGKKPYTISLYGPQGNLIKSQPTSDSIAAGTFPFKEGGNYTIKVVDADGNTDEIILPINPPKLQFSTFTVSPEMIEVPGEVTFLAMIKGGTPPYYCRLDGPKGLIGTDSSPDGQYKRILPIGSADDFGMYILTVTDKKNDTIQAFVNLKGTLPPNISDFKVEPPSVELGKIAQFKAIITGGKRPYACKLSGPKGDVATDQNVESFSYSFQTKNKDESGVYTLLVTDSNGKTDTASTKLTVIDPPPPPAILVNLLADKTLVAIGDSVKFKGDVTGGKSPFTFTLIRNNQKEKDKKTKVPTPQYEYNLKNVAASDSGTYTLSVKDSVGTTGVSKGVSITIQYPLTIPKFDALYKEKKVSTALTIGDSVTFKAIIAGGTKPYTGILFRSNVLVDSSQSKEGVYSHSLIIKSLTDQTYRFSATDRSTPPDSASYVPPITLNVVGAIIVKITASTTIATVGETIACTVYTRGKVKNYYWLKNNTPVQNNPNSPVYQIMNAKEEDSGTYSCKITYDTLGEATSASIPIKVNKKTILISNFFAKPNPVAVNKDVIFTANLSNGTPPYVCTLNGPNCSDVIKIPNGQFQYTLKSIQADKSGLFVLTADDAELNSGSSKPISVLAQQPPSIDKDIPSAVELWTGKLYRFSLVAKGDGLKYQWYKNNIPLQYQVGPTYEFQVSQLSQGTYYCKVWNRVDSVFSTKCTVTVKQSALIIRSLRDTIVSLGDSATFELAATGFGQLKYVWYKNGNVISIPVNSPRLEIKPVKVSDAGKYRCDVSNEGGTVQSNTAKLNIKGSVKFVLHSKDTAVYPGKRVTLYVYAIGTPPIQYQWFFNDRQLTDQKSDSLVIDPVTSASEGKYHCTAWNNEKKIETSTASYITLLTAISIKTQPKSVTCDIGATVSFSVEATGNPPLKYLWMKDTSVFSAETSSTFTIRRVTSTDAGVYRCRVSNGLKNENMVISDYALLSINGPVIFVKDPENKRVSMGKSVLFEAFASGSEPKTYQWQKDKKNISNAKSYSFMILSAALSDSGKYRCIASNRVNNDTTRDTSNEATLVVVEPPSFLEHPQSLTLEEGQSANFCVKVQGTLPIYYQWFWQEGLPCSKKVKKDSLYDTFRIEQVSNAEIGEYFCKITSDSTDTVGTVSNKARLSLTGATITVVSPTSKDNFLMDQKTNITWFCKGSEIKTVRIDLSLNSGALYNPIAANVPNKAGTNLYEWLVPQEQAASCKIKITNENGFQSNVSEGYFSINRTIKIQDKKKNKTTFTSHFILTPNPLYLSNPRPIQMQIVPLERLENARIYVIDPLGSLVYSSVYSLRSAESHKPFVFGTWNLLDTRGKKINPGTYGIILEIRNTVGDKNRTSVLFGVKQ